MRILLFNLLLFSIAGYALWRGGAPERIVAILFVCAGGVSRVIALSMIRPFEDVEVGFLIVDCTLLAGLVAVALYADRFWPINMAALQIVQVGVHLIKFLKPDTLPWVYAVTLGVWGYPMLALLGWGTYQHRTRLKRFGVDAPWSRSFDRSPEVDRRTSPTG